MATLPFGQAESRELEAPEVFCIASGVWAYKCFVVRQTKTYQPLVCPGWRTQLWAMHTVRRAVGEMC